MRKLALRSVPPLLVVAVLTAAAASACGPSIDAAAKSDIDRRVAALQPGSTAVSAPAPGVFAPMPLAVGQWTQYKMVNDKNEPSFFTYKVVGQDGDAVWLEVVNDSYHGRTIQKMLVAFGNRTDPGQIQIRAISTKDAKGHVDEVPPPLISLMQGMYRTAIAGLVINWQGMPQEAASVPAGRFDGCFKTRTEAQYGTFKSTADSWSHPAVPLSGAVRSQGVDHQFTMELAAFGTSGAVSEF